MSSSTISHGLKTLILSGQPIVAIHTIEEDRAAPLLRAVARELRLPMFDWSVTQGLTRGVERTPVHGTVAPRGLLKHLGLSRRMLGSFLTWLQE